MRCGFSSRVPTYEQLMCKWYILLGRKCFENEYHHLLRIISAKSHTEGTLSELILSYFYLFF